MTGVSGQYFDESPTAASRTRILALRLADAELELETDRGVFAADRIDLGTRVLLDVAPPPPAGDVLDLGCGYGPIALTLARRNPAARVMAVDVNERARALTVANAARNHLANITVAAPDDVDPVQRFTALYSNPPVHVGKAVLHDLLSLWLPRLLPDASAWLVVQKHLGSDSLARWLNEQGWPARKIASRKGYRVLEVSARP